MQVGEGVGECDEQLIGYKGAKVHTFQMSTMCCTDLHVKQDDWVIQVLLETKIPESTTNKI